MSAAALILLLAVTGKAFASDTETVGNLVIYLGAMPAAIVGHPRTHPEPSIPRSPPPGEHEYHVIAALFDARSGRRVTNARVSARVSGVGIAAVEKTLEPMQVGDTLAYGNFFRLTGPGPAVITLTIWLPGEAEPVTAFFDHWY